MKKLIIFDLDGTLLDTLTDITNSVNDTLKHYGKSLRTEEEIKYLLGFGPQHLIEKSFDKSFSEEEFKEVYKFYDERYALNQNIFTKPYSGIIELLNILKKDYLLAVCSNKQDHLTKSLIKTVFPNLFSVVVGANPYQRKPNPEMPNYIMEKLNVTPKETLFIGDTSVDIKTALNAKIDVVAVLWGFRKKADLVAFNPNAFIKEPLELLELLKKRFNN
ncbi:MAG: HAD-IA family hydrolase [Acholeplasmataceae bacterium]|nr:HAD-IA family hydrolase [Acholeplasmataceae bacterium]MCK9289169.1 HAD-IA family hydrolase [Acholeplasmataceae bacterium]HHT39579.1 HAD-IA family hydrolase [Acholeplasmataceae bacterium]